MDCFRVPTDIPQDLLLIKELVSDYLPPVPVPVSSPSTLSDDDISSSSEEEADSEDEVMNLVTNVDRRYESPSRFGSLFLLLHAALSTVTQRPSSGGSDTTSDASSSDAEPDSESERGDNHEEMEKLPGLGTDLDLDEDEHGGPSAKAVLKTTHEAEDGDDRIMVPEIDAIPEGEALEHVGEIMGVQSRAVIVRGTPPMDGRHANMKALDAETLLCFEDRTVLGYVSRNFLLVLHSPQPLIVDRFMTRSGLHHNLFTWSSSAPPLHLRNCQHLRFHRLLVLHPMVLRNLIQLPLLRQ
jgi:H/ACA ribonucleoprotein complex non-core subunit NAF1